MARHENGGGQRCLRKSKAPRVINVSNAVAAALPKLAVNSICPGWVRTNIGRVASRSIEECADTVVWLAADAPQSSRANFCVTGKRCAMTRLHQRYSVTGYELEWEEEEEKLQDFIPFVLIFEHDLAEEANWWHAVVKQFIMELLQ